MRAVRLGTGLRFHAGVVRGIDTDSCSRLLYSKRLRDRSRVEEEEEEGAWRVPRSLELMTLMIHEPQRGLGGHAPQRNEQSERR